MWLREVLPTQLAGPEVTGRAECCLLTFFLSLWRKNMMLFLFIWKTMRSSLPGWPGDRLYSRKDRVT